MGIYAEWIKANKNFKTWKCMQAKKNANHVQKKLIVMTKFPDIGEMAKIPWHFFKIPWQFPDLEKILFFPDFSLTRGNPAILLPPAYDGRLCFQSVTTGGGGGLPHLHPIILPMVPCPSRGVPQWLVPGPFWGYPSTRQEATPSLVRMGHPPPPS